MAFFVDNLEEFDCDDNDDVDKRGGRVSMNRWIDVQMFAWLLSTLSASSALMVSHLG